MTNSIRIDQLHLRVPGMSREEANHLGITVAQQLARQLPALTRSGNLSGLHVRLAIPTGTPRECLSSVVAAGIAKKIS